MENFKGNVKFLKGDEVRYELQARGFEPKASLADEQCYETLHNLIFNNVPIRDISSYNWGQVEIIQEFQSVIQAAHDFEAGCSLFPVCEVTHDQGQRLATRLNHWIARAGRIWPLLNSCEIKSKLNDSVIIMHEIMHSLNSQQQEINVTHSQLDMSDAVGSHHCVEEGGHAEVPSSSPHSQEAASLVKTNQCVGNFKMVKLPNPIETILRDVQTMNADLPVNAFLFLKFFSNFLSQCKLVGLQGSVIYQILHGHTTGNLSELLVKAAANNYTSEQFHRLVIHRFIPPRIVNQLLTEYYFKPQMSTETFKEYCDRVKQTAEALCTGYSEQQILCCIGAGAVKCEVRALFLSNSRPSNFDQLDDLEASLLDIQCAQDIVNPVHVSLNNAQSNDFHNSSVQRGRETPQVEMNNSRPNSNPGTHSSSGPRGKVEFYNGNRHFNHSNANEQRDRRPIVCFYCNEQGHYKNNCRKFKHDQESDRRNNTHYRANNNDRGRRRNENEDRA